MASAVLVWRDVVRVDVAGMIVLRNYLVPRGRPDVYPLDVIMCHPDDRDEIVRELETLDRMRDDLVDGYEQVRGDWTEYLRRRDES